MKSRSSTRLGMLSVLLLLLLAPFAISIYHFQYDALKVKDRYVSQGFETEAAPEIRSLDDQNRDGWREMVILDPGNSTYGNSSGLVQFFWGGPNVRESFAMDQTDIFFSDIQNSSVGADVVFHDMDLDSYYDLFVGAPGADGGKGVVMGYNSVKLNIQDKGALLDRGLATWVLSEEACYGYGAALGSGDVTGNGEDDLAILSTGNGVVPPKLHLHFSNWVIDNYTFILEAPAVTGNSTVEVLDMDGDLREDVVITAPEQGRIGWLSLNDTITTVGIPGADPDGVVRFTGAIYNPENTFGWAGNHDGWDTSQPHLYDSGTDPASVRYNQASGNARGAIRNVERVNMLQIEVGGVDGSGEWMSGAYGVNFNLTPAELEGVEIISLNLDYTFENWGFEWDERMWIKGNITDPSGTSNWLSQMSDSEQQVSDATPEIWTLRGSGTNGPQTNGNGRISLDITDIVDTDGDYYLALGAKIRKWTASVECFAAGFDNISISMLRMDHTFTTVSGAGQFGGTVRIQDVDLDGKEDLLLGSPQEGAVRIYRGSEPYWGTARFFNRFDCNVTIQGKPDQGFGTAMGSLPPSAFRENISLFISDPEESGGDGVGVIYVFELPMPDGGLTLLDAVDTMYGPEGEEAFGHSIVPAGDSEGDEYEDIIIFGWSDTGQLTHTVIDRSPTPPEIKIIHPGRMGLISGIVEFRVRVWDMDDDVSPWDIEYYQSVDNASFAFLGNPDRVEGNEGILDLNTMNMTNRRYFLKAEVEDGFGLRSIIYNGGVDVFNHKPPKVFLNNPQSGDVIYGIKEISAQVVPPADENIDFPIPFFYSLDNLTWVEFKNFSVKNPGNQYNAYFDTFAFDDGPVWFTVNASTEYGLKAGDRTEGPVYIDNKYAPEVEILRPYMNTTVSGIVNITVEAKDKDGDIEPPLRMYISMDLEALDWELIGNMTGPHGNDTYHLLWDTWDWSNGEYYLRAYAADRTGLYTQETYNQTVLVHNPYSPSVEILEISEGDSIQGTISIRASVADPDMNFLPGDIRVQYGDTLLDQWIDLPGVSYSGGIARASWNTRTVQNGEYTIRVLVTDADNLTAEDTRTVGVDNPYSPSIQLHLEPSDVPLIGSIRINFTVRDDEPIRDEGITVRIMEGGVHYEIQGLVREVYGGDFVPWMNISFYIVWDTAEKDEAGQPRFPDGQEYFINVSVEDEDGITAYDQTDFSYILRNRDTDVPEEDGGTSIEPWMYFAGALIVFLLFLIIIFAIVLMSGRRKREPDEGPLPDLRLEGKEPEVHEEALAEEQKTAAEELYGEEPYVAPPSYEEMYEQEEEMPLEDALSAFMMKDEATEIYSSVEGPTLITDRPPAPPVPKEEPLWHEELEVELPEGVLPTRREKVKPPKRRKRTAGRKEEKRPEPGAALAETWEEVEEWGMKEAEEEIEEFEDEWEDEEEALEVHCPRCGSVFELPPDFEGGRFKCPECGKGGKIKL